MKLGRMLVFLGLLLTSCVALMASSDRGQVELASDPNQQTHRFIKVIVKRGDHVVVTQTYSCDRKDCWPTQESIEALSGPPSPSGRFHVQRQRAFVSSLVWDGGSLALMPIGIDVSLYNADFQILDRASVSQRIPVLSAIRIWEKNGAVRID